MANAFPSIASAGGLDIPQEVNIAVPALLDIGQSLVRAIEASAVVALFVTAIRGMPRAERFADVTAILALFFIALDSNTKPSEAPMMLLSSITGALLAWFIVRFVMRENLLAYPLAAALALLLGSAATLLQNHRSDLMVNGVVDILAVMALVVWIAYPSPAEAGAPSNG